MTTSDITLLGKKIAIGIIITLVPFIILFGALWFTQKILSSKGTNPTVHSNH